MFQFRQAVGNPHAVGKLQKDRATREKQEAKRVAQAKHALTREAKQNQNLKQSRNTWDPAHVGQVLHTYFVEKDKHRKRQDQAARNRNKHARRRATPLTPRLDIFVAEAKNGTGSRCKDVPGMGTFEKMQATINWHAKTTSLPFPWTVEQFTAFAGMWKDNTVQRKPTRTNTILSTLVKTGVVSVDVEANTQPPPVCASITCGEEAVVMCRSCKLSLCDTCSSVVHSLPTNSAHQPTKIVQEVLSFVSPSAASKKRPRETVDPTTTTQPLKVGRYMALQPSAPDVAVPLPLEGQAEQLQIVPPPEVSDHWSATQWLGYYEDQAQRRNLALQFQVVHLVVLVSLEHDM